MFLYAFKFSNKHFSKMKITFYYMLVFALIFTSCKTNDEKKPYQLAEAPMAKQIAEELTIHDDTRIDNYFWMRLSDAQKMLKLQTHKLKMF